MQLSYSVSSRDFFFCQDMESRCTQLEDSNSELEEHIAQLEKENANLRVRMRQVVQGTAAAQS